MSFGQPTTGRFKCPACEARFNRPRFIMRKPWYYFQHAVPACPQCKVFLRDRRRATVWPAYAVMALVVIWTQFEPALREAAAGALLALAVLLICWESYKRWKIRNEVRYVLLDD